MRALMRAHDWSTSPLGSPETWPAALRFAVDMMLASRFPMFVAWGTELPYLYNDACIPIVGARHPSALGRPFHAIWPEAWKDLSPLLQRTLAGESVYCEDMLFRLQRNGFPEETWFTFSYSSIRDETGQVKGVLSVATETTTRVLAENRQAFRTGLDERLRLLSEPNEIMAIAAEMLGERLRVGQVAYAEIDEAGEFAAVARDWSDGSIPSIAGRHRLKDFGLDLARDLQAGETIVVGNVAEEPRTSRPDPLTAFERISIAAFLIVPLIKAGRLVACLAVHHSTPRPWSPLDVALAADVAERTWAAVERARAEALLRESEEQHRSLTDALPLFVSFVDRDRRYRIMNRAYATWFRLPREAILGRTVREVLGDEAYAAREEQIAAALRGEIVQFDAFTPTPDGSRRDTFLEYIPRRGPDGEVDGFYVVGLDVTERLAAEKALRESENRLRLALDASRMAIWELDLRNETMVGSPELGQAFGFPPGSTPSLTEFRARYAPGEHERMKAALRAAVVKGEHFLDLETACVWPDGSVHGLLLRGQIHLSSNGMPERIVGVLLDITERKRVQEHQQLLINELNHRVKNTLATVQSIASQSLRHAPTREAAQEAVESRLIALSRAHDVLTQENWEAVGLHDIVAQAIGPYRGKSESRITFAGPAIRIPARMALAFAMALQELATNAVKYGSLSSEAGEVGIRWILDRASAPPRLQLRWEETGGPPVEPPTRRGFGTRLIERSLAQDLGGEVHIDFAPAGVVCLIETYAPS